MDATWFLGIATVAATVLGPILAVQAQKYLERSQQAKEQKMKIFTVLMSTRAATLSIEHVQALNMIDLAFNGGTQARRSRTETEVIDAWRDYLDNLNTQIDDSNVARWSEKRNEGLIQLLSAMASDLNLRYDRVLLRNGAYMPRGHSELETDQQKFRYHAIRVLSGEQPLTMKVSEFPADPSITQSQLELQNDLRNVLNGEGKLKVIIETDASAKKPESKEPA